MIHTQPPLDKLLAKLPDARQTSETQWQARCPAHDDRRASLSIGQGDDGRALVRCQAGCETRAVVDSLGLTMRDLMPNTNGHANGKATNGKPRIVATYDYRNADGVLLYQAVRMEPKDFRQRTPKPGGGWSWKLNGVARVLYRLPELLAADPAQPVFVVEGEKDADSLAAMGLVATCNAGGASKWRAEYNEHLRGRHVVIVPDYDEPGRKHAKQVANALHGVAASVAVLELPGLPDKGDVSDWLDNGGSAAELLAMAGAAELWVPSAKPAKAKRAKRAPAHESTEVQTDDAPAVKLSLDKPEQRTESANARRLVELYGDNLRWCEPWGKWLAWNGKQWKPDDTRQAAAWAKRTAAIYWKWLGVNAMRFEKPQTDAITSFIRASTSANGVRNALELAKSEDGIPILPGKLDQHPMLLNVDGGTLDLTTGELREHRREDLITKLCAVEYDPAATCPRWLAFLDEIFAGDAELTGFIQRAVGYSLTGRTDEHALFFCHGTGANGKSVFLNTIQRLVGPDYGMKAPADLLMVKHGQAHPTELADLHGKRFINCIEADDGKRLAESLLKELTGGDNVRARRMREDFWEFAPTHTVWLASNHKPVIRGTDHGIWRRIKMIPFTVTIPDERQDKQLPERLAAELPGILAWAVRGCLDWQRKGLGEPEAVKAATAEYQSEQDVLGVFLADCCIIGRQYRAKASSIYSAYKQWCDSTGEYCVTQRKFGDALTERQFERTTSNGTWYIGLALLAE